MNIQILDGISQIAKIYNFFILDIWGVLMDGVQPYREAPHCLQQLHAHNKTVILLSNAPRQAHIVRERLNTIGIPSSLYNDILSSGEATRLALTQPTNPILKNLGSKYFYIGPDRDKALLDGLGYQASQSLEESDFMLTTGPDSENDDLESYDKLFGKARGLNLPMICANPDHVVVRQTGERLLCAGALADRYERSGGEAIYFGKPHKDIYSICINHLADPPLEEIIAIGDTLGTDIQGANQFGVDTALVVGGVTAEELGMASGQMPATNKLRDHCLKADIFPNYAMPLFRW